MHAPLISMTLGMSQITGVILLALLVVCSARVNLIYPFEIDTLLVCHVPNPFGDIPGEPLSIPEATPRVSLAPTNVNNDGSYQWLPLESGYVAFVVIQLMTLMSFRFRMPPSPNNPRLRMILRGFLGADFNTALTSLDPPTSVPPKACDLLPAIEGSAGRSDKTF